VNRYLCYAECPVKKKDSIQPGTPHISEKQIHKESCHGFAGVAFQLLLQKNDKFAWHLFAI